MSGPRKQPPAPPKALTDLDDDALREIEKRLDPQSASRLARASKEAHKIFQPQVSDIKTYVQPLLDHIAKGELAQADQLLQQLKQQDEYLLQQVLNYKGKVTDPSERTFTGITALQYALWAYDRFAWETLRPYMQPQDMLDQLKELETTGVEYNYQGQRYQNQRHYDFQPLLDAYQRYSAYFDAPDFNWTEANRRWVQEIGENQKKVPWHVAAEYCSDQPFVDRHNQPPAFNQRPRFPAEAQGAQYYNYLARPNCWEDFYSGVLGISCAIYKGPRAVASGGPVRVGSRAIDSAAIAALCATRKSDLAAAALESALLAEISNQSRP